MNYCMTKRKTGIDLRAYNVTRYGQILPRVKTGYFSYWLLKELGTLYKW